MKPEQDQWLTKEQVDAQCESLGCQPPSLYTLKDWSRRGAIARQRGIGGRGQTAEWPPTTVAETTAGMTVMLANRSMSKAKIAFIRELALQIESCSGPAELLEVAHNFAALPNREVGAIDLGTDLVLWLRTKRETLRKLYGKTQPHSEKIRDRYFESEHFTRLVFGIVNDLFKGWRFERGRLITPHKKPSVEGDAVKNFPRAA